MMKMKEIIAFSYGDSNTKKCWSGVPYYLLKELENSGVTVNRVDISYKENNFIRLYNKVIRCIEGIDNDLATFDRSNLGYRIREKKIDAGLKNIQMLNMH